jgi:DNA-binding Xre family transcriptional regulator
MKGIKVNKTLEWRLNVVMSERRIKTITELKRRLDAIGVGISSAQLGRVVWERPQKINIELLEGLVTVLECEVSDILKVVVTSGSDKTQKPESSENAAKEKDAVKERKPRVKPVLVPTSGDLKGPQLIAFPLPERKK